MIRKNGAGDLVKGEKCVFLTFQSFLYAHCYSRYCSVDFIVFSTIAFVFLLRIVLTYDIICQWSKNFRTRMEEYPEYMQIPDTTRVDVAIPGWHINGHGDTCRNKFNLSYMEGVGRTVGEDIETTWAGTNPLASSVREMGPAARHDTLNDHWNGWNFRKIVGFRTFPLSFYIHLFLIISFIGTLFMKRFHEAHKMSAIQTDVFNQLSATFSTDTVRKWEKMVVTWNANPKAPNPYKEPKSGEPVAKFHFVLVSHIIPEATLQDVRLQLAKEDAAEAALGVLPRHKVTLPALLMAGLELEDSQ